MGDIAQAEHLAALLALVHAHSATLEAPLRAALLKRRDDVLDALATLCRRAAAERSAAAPAAGGGLLALPGGVALPPVAAASGRSRVSDPPLTLPPPSPLSQRPLNTPPLPLHGGALVLQTPKRSAAAPTATALPWRLVLQAAELLCVALSGAGSDPKHTLRLWPPGQSSAAAQLQSPQYALSPL